MLFKGLLNADSETTDLKNPAPWFVRMFGAETSTGERVTIDSALAIPTVYRCINIKANAIAMLPLQAFKRTNKGREREKRHIVSRLLETRPNPFQSPFKFKHLTETHRNTWGNAYINVDWRADGRPEALWLLNPSLTEPVMDTKNNKLYYRTTLPDGTPTVINESDIIHLTALSTDGLKGKSPIQVARESIGSTQAATKFKGGFYKNGASNNGVLKVPGMLNPDAKEVIRSEWENANSGVNNAQRIAILDAGLEFDSISMPLKDAQFIESMQFDKTEIATMFDIPLHMVNNLDRATHSNIEHENLSFIQNTLSPILRQYEEEFLYKLFSDTERQKYYLKFNLESLLRADKKTQAEYYQIMSNIGALSVNKILELEDQNGIGPAGDVHRVDLNHVSIEIADEYQLNKAGALKGGEDNETEEN